MLKRYPSRFAIAAVLLSMIGLFAAVKPARADEVEITLNNLTFDNGSGGLETFTGSFLYDSALNSISPINIAATGLIDFPSLGVDVTGYEPYQFEFDDGFFDYLVLNISSGLSDATYGYADASLFPFEGLASLGFSDETATSGSIDVSNVAVATTPEPSSLLLSCVGFLLLYLGRVMGRRLGAECDRGV